MVRSEDCAEPSFAARREARRLGIAMAAIMPMIATTMSSSISEKPFWFLFIIFRLLLEEISWFFCLRATGFDLVELTAARDLSRPSQQGPCHDEHLRKKVENATKL